jgi:hypothetical protein
MALLYRGFQSLFPAASQYRGFCDRLDIDGVLVVRLLSVDCACAADARGGATSVLAGLQQSCTPHLNFSCSFVLSFSVFGC